MIPYHTAFASMLAACDVGVVVVVKVCKPEVRRSLTTRKLYIGINNSSGANESNLQSSTICKYT